MAYIDDAFDNLKSNLEITKTESELAQSRHKLVRKHIESSWQLTDHFLTGSYNRQTKTKKLKDVDIFAVLDPAGPQGSLAKGSGTAAIVALRDVLATRWSDLDTDDNVVTIKYGDEDVASYEVAPVFPREGHGYRMPNGARWMDTDPQEHAALVTAKNKECDEKFVPFVKIFRPSCIQTMRLPPTRPSCPCTRASAMISSSNGDSGTRTDTTLRYSNAAACSSATRTAGSRGWSAPTSTFPR